VILRDRDANVNWADEADGTLEERIYYCHNWRGDVSVLVEDDGDMIEWVKYSSYGIPFDLPKGDQDSDGDLDVTDVTVIGNWGGKAQTPQPSGPSVVACSRPNRQGAHKYADPEGAQAHAPDHEVTRTSDDVLESAGRQVRDKQAQRALDRPRPAKERYDHRQISNPCS
jgi:hypothetical protein